MKSNFLTVIGPDVSFYQDEPTTPRGIDFARMKLSAQFVIIRAGQNRWIDTELAENWSAAKATGLPRGSYWFWDSRVKPAEQAELWVNALGGDLGELPLWADYEEAYGGVYGGWKNFKIFLERLKELVGSKAIGIYTGYWYFKDHSPNPTTQAADLEYFHQYPLWIANYGVSVPSVPAPWAAAGWDFWQYTDNGNGALYGAESASIDLNYFNGDQAAFQTYLSGLTVPPVENPMRYKIISNMNMSLRKDHNTFAAKIDNLLAGKEAFGNELWTALADGNQVKAGDQWLHVLTLNGKAADGWIAVVHLGVVYCTLTDTVIVPPPPPPPPPVGNPILDSIDVIVDGVVYTGGPIILTPKV